MGATAKNTAAILSAGAAAGAVGENATHFSGWSAAANGTRYFRFDNTDVGPLELGQKARIIADALVLSQATGVDETDDQAQRGIEGKISGGMWIQFEQSSGTVITDMARVQINQAGFTVAQEDLAGDLNP